MSLVDLGLNTRKCIPDFSGKRKKYEQVVCSVICDNPTQIKIGNREIDPAKLKDILGLTKRKTKDSRKEEKKIGVCMYPVH